MARTKIAETSAFTGRVDRLAMDWALRQETCRIAEQSALADFVARAESLCAEVDSGVLWRNTDWNIFEVLGRPRLEDAYSSVIGWLMNPTAPHGLRDAFLNEFFQTAFQIAAPPGTLDCSVAVKKRIPVGEVDIEVKGSRWWLIVENKIDAAEGKDQTRKYAKHYRQFAKLGKSFFPVFLSPEGKRPESRDFTPMSYSDLRHALESVCEIAHPAAEVAHLIQHFIKNIIYKLES